MKKFYFLALCAFTAFTMNAQVSVTFSVDMNDAALADGDIVTLGGDFQGWMPAAETFTDEDGNGVYVFTYDTDTGLTAGQEVRYKFVINGWGTNEFGEEGAEPGDCNEDDGAGNINRVCVKFTPNPATDRTLISFENDTNEAHNIIVTSVTGQVVETLKTTGNTAELSVADFAKGMYFVTFRNEAGEQGTEKLIVR